MHWLTIHEHATPMQQVHRRARGGLQLAVVKSIRLVLTISSVSPLAAVVQCHTFVHAHAHCLAYALAHTLLMHMHRRVYTRVATCPALFDTLKLRLSCGPGLPAATLALLPCCLRQRAIYFSIYCRMEVHASCQCTSLPPIGSSSTVTLVCLVCLWW
jgi:hypothetical protein